MDRRRASRRCVLVGATLVLTGCWHHPDPPFPPSSVRTGPNATQSLSELVAQMSRTRATSETAAAHLAGHYRAGTLCGLTDQPQAQYGVYARGVELYDAAATDVNAWIDAFGAAVAVGEGVGAGSPAQTAFARATSSASRFLEWSRDPGSCRPSADPVGAGAYGAPPVGSGGGGAAAAADVVVTLLPSLVDAGVKVANALRDADRQEREWMRAAVQATLDKQRWRSFLQVTAGAAPPLAGSTG